MKNQDAILKAIADERQRQDAKWGEQNHQPIEWVSILTEEVGEVAKAALESHFKHKGKDPDYIEYRKELIQVAAVAVAMLESLDRQTLEE